MKLKPEKATPESVQKMPPTATPLTISVARLAELQRFVIIAERRRAAERSLNPLLFALGGFLAGALSFAAGMWAASRYFL